MLQNDTFYCYELKHPLSLFLNLNYFHLIDEVIYFSFFRRDSIADSVSSNSPKPFFKASPYTHVTTLSHQIRKILCKENLSITSITADHSHQTHRLNLSFQSHQSNQLHQPDQSHSPYPHIEVAYRCGTSIKVMETVKVKF